LTAVFHVFLRDPRMAQERAEAATAIATEHDIPFELSYGTLVRGWALAEQGHLTEGIAEMRRAITAGEETGFTARPRWFAYLAEACARSEGSSVGLNLLAEGMALMERTGERMYEAELHRVKGELLLMHDAANGLEAEHCFRTAIEVARRQAGKSLELRATMSLAGLLAKQGKGDEARAMLADIYRWFTVAFRSLTRLSDASVAGATRSMGRLPLRALALASGGSCPYWKLRKHRSLAIHLARL
jgi:predicted ATPase